MVPNIIHFIFFGSGSDGLPFSFIHYLAIKSAYVCNKPRVIKFYYDHEPNGEWWDLSRKYVEGIRVTPSSHIFENPLLHYAHQSDVLRLECLLKEGGIYLDIDVICFRPFTPLLKYKCVMGKQGTEGLCNAVLLAQKEADFLKIWYEAYASFRGKGRHEYWDEHSVQMPLKIAQNNSSLIHIEPEISFFYPHFNSAHLLWSGYSPLHPNVWLKLKLCYLLMQRSYCTHLVESIHWDHYLKDLTPEKLYSMNNNFSKLLRKRGIHYLENPKSMTIVK